MPSWPGVRRASWVGSVQKGEKLGKLERKEVETQQRIRLLLCHFTRAGRVFLGPWGIGEVGVSRYWIAFTPTFCSHSLSCILSFLYVPSYQPEHFVIALADENRLYVLKKKNARKSKLSSKFTFLHSNFLFLQVDILVMKTQIIVWMSGKTQ